MRNGKRKHNDVFGMIESRMTPEAIRRSDAKAKRMILALRLGEFRRRLGKDQSSVKGFSQPAVSKIEARGDVKLSTLIEYCRGLGAEVRVVAKRKGKEFVLVEG